MADTAYSPVTTLGSANAEVRQGVSGYGGVAIQILGTFSGTLTFEASVQGGEFKPFRVTASDNSTAVTTATAPGIYVGSCVGFQTVRARMTSYSSGTAAVIIAAVAASPSGSGGGGGTGSDVNLIEVGGAGIALGQAAMAASLPVVIASDQTAIPVTGSISATNPSVAATGAAVPADATYVGADDGTGTLKGLAAAQLDYATGGSTVPQSLFGIALPAASGPVAGGTSTNPVRVDPTGTTTQPVSIAAGTALIGQVAASPETSTVYNGTTALTPKFAVISASSSGNNTLVAAVTGKKVRVLAYNFISNGTVNAKFQSGASGTDLTGLKYCVANMGLVANFNPAGWFETGSNTLLNLNLSAAVAVGGELTYVEV